MVDVIERREVCTDCAMWISNRDLSCLDLFDEVEASSRYNEIVESVDKLPGHPVVEEVESQDFSKNPCQCCGSPLAGFRHTVAILG